MVRSPTEVQVMNLMDTVIDAVAQQVFGKQVTAANVQPDGLGTTYHESGTLRMGDDPTQSVLAHGRSRYVPRDRRGLAISTKLRFGSTLVHDPDAAELPAGTRVFHETVPIK